VIRNTIAGGISVSCIGLGCSRFGSLRGLGRRRASALLLAAADLGINLFDTANIYGQGDSEKIIGDTFRRRRDQVVIVTKAGYPMPAMGPAKRLAKPLLRPVAKRLGSKEAAPGQAPPPSADSRPFDVGDLRSSLDGSLRRLQTDYVDVFMLHSLPESLVQDEILVSFLADLKREGKARSVGFSMTRFPEDLATIVDDRIDVVGSAVNVAATDNVAALAGLADKGVAVLAYQVFASGALLRSHDRHEEPDPARHLRFALSQPGVVSAVGGASSVEQLAQNAGAVAASAP
jgi:aryl-alcohol dehydrogenase-like predicted oxidoreductase